MDFSQSRGKAEEGIEMPASGWLFEQELATLHGELANFRVSSKFVIKFLLVRRQSSFLCSVVGLISCDCLKH